MKILDGRKFGMLVSRLGAVLTLIVMSLLLIRCQVNAPQPAHTGSSPWPAPTKADHFTLTSNGDIRMNPHAERAIDALTVYRGVDRSKVTVETIESAEWRDSSLGCPKPGIIYAQVITPGFRITLRVDGTLYSYHTDLNQRVTLCENHGDS